MKESNEEGFFNCIGYSFPANSLELREFKNMHRDYIFKTDVNSINPAKILASLVNTDIKITRIDYHKRTVLAAEIVFRLHTEWSMGHIKLQKLMYLCQNVMNMSVHTNFLKQAMGPYDPVMMRSLDKQLKEHKWFEFKKDEFPKYKPLVNIGGHTTWYERYYSDQLVEISYLIETFRKIKSDKTELVATIYACWLEIKESHQIFSEPLIIKKVYEWSSHKQKFSEKDILDSLVWMKEKGVYPK